MNKKLFSIVVLSLMISLASCKHNETTNHYTRGYELEECDYENPIDSIIRNTDESVRFDEVYKYLIANPEFVKQSDSVGYHKFSCGDYEECVVWKDCGEIRIYTIPCPTMYSTYCYNIVQFLNNGRVDTAFLEDNNGGMESLYAIKDKQGKTHYILKTRLDVEHQGIIAWEYISAFSIENGRLIKEKLFHTKSRQYDNIEVECGGQRYLPLDYSTIVLINMENFEESDDNPVFVIAEINNNDWPTGYGLKYQWNGNWFEYVGKCQYDANEYFFLF